MPHGLLHEDRVLERLLLSVPEVTSTARRTGRAELDEHVQGVESAEIDVRLAMMDRPRQGVLDDLRQKASLLPGTNVTIGQPISHRIDHMLSGTRANIAVKIFGDDLQTLRGLAAQVQAGMAQIEGVVDLSTEAQADIPTLRVKVEPDALSAAIARVTSRIYDALSLMTRLETRSFWETLILPLLSLITQASLRIGFAVSGPSCSVSSAPGIMTTRLRPEFFAR